MTTKRKLLIFIPIAIVVLIQFVRIDTTNPVIDLNNDFFKQNNAPIEIESIVRNSCYDCHSNQTNYPWYSRVAPVSWMLKNHIVEAREHLNFSEWSEYSLEKQNSLKKECIEEIEDNEMPLKSYTLFHSDAKLSSNSKQLLIDWLTSESNKEK